MSESTTSTEADYGPLTGLIGTWQGDKGLDIAPGPEGTENNPYYETIEYSACGNITNAETQVLAALYYRQIVKRKSNDGVFHDQTGYWMWDVARQLIMHSLSIPRGVCVLAGGRYSGSKAPTGEVIIEVMMWIGELFSRHLWPEMHVPLHSVRVLQWVMASYPTRKQPWSIFMETLSSTLTRVS